MDRAEYANYLCTPHWKLRRKAALEYAEHRCQICNKTGMLHVHHRTYERLWAERPADLTVLCPKCHSLFHGIPLKSEAPKGKRGAQPSKPKNAARNARRSERKRASKAERAKVDAALGAIVKATGKPPRMSDYGKAHQPMD